MRSLAIWVLLLAVIAIPLAAALASPLLAWRDPIYIAAGLAGVLAMSALLLQPLLAMGRLPGLQGRRGRRVHRLTGACLVIALVAHVVGLWITSPPDMVDALLFVSPTPFSAWGVIAMWGVIATALLAILRRPLKLKPRIWQLSHTGLAAVIVTGSVLHAMLIEGTMEPFSKAILCVIVFLATAGAVHAVWIRARSS